MMKKLTLFFVVSVLLAFQAMAAIELDVNLETYTFTGTNTANNYKYVLSPYEFTNGPQFQLVITPIDPTMPAFFTSDDLQDQNYWEPMFKYYTAQLAGQEMAAQDNIKRLYLGDVKLLQGQFADYNTLHIIGFDLNGDYILPKGCFQYAGQHLDEINVHSNGLMTLEPNSVPADKVFDVNVNTTELQQVWEQYKQQYNCQYIVNLQAETGINSFSIVINMGHENEEQAIPESGMPEVDLTENGTNAEGFFVIDGFKATTTGDMTAVKMFGAVYLAEGQANQWHEVVAQKVNDGNWQATGQNIDLLKDLVVGNTYILEVYLEATDAEGNKYYYNNDGANYKVRFMVGEQQEPVTFYDQETAGLGLTINGTLVDFTLNGDGTKTPDGHLGAVQSLSIDNFWVRCLRDSGVELGDVSLQWRLLSNNSIINDWNRVDYQYQNDEDGNKLKKFFGADNLYIDLMPQCETGQDYTLEVMYQLIDSHTGQYYFFAKNQEVGRFYFSVGNAGVQGDLNGDGHVDISDVNAVINMMLGKNPNTPAGDVTGDGNVDISDVNAIINIMLGKR